MSGEEKLDKGDSLRDSSARAYFGKERDLVLLNLRCPRDDRTLGKKKPTIAPCPRHYQTALRYCVTGFKSMSSLEVSILNK